MKFRAIRALRGPNIWSPGPVLEAWLDLEGHVDPATPAIPGLDDRLRRQLMALDGFQRSSSKRHEFLEKLRRGTGLPEVTVHLAATLLSARLWANAPKRPPSSANG